ncbi:PAS domain S-box [Chamaesiphon minutus PCC 6605]|uniref:Circadian input-output histidine kinase CikA n=2 Tax=Chamaesiphon TaxID=217161 RepID=K9UA45_CHAP6|nr:PAS domain S-box [Chamaesiphon minutus PCC 6605]
MTMSGFNFHLSGYHPIEELYRDAKTVVYRAIRMGQELGAESDPVAIKILASVYPTARELQDFRHQYAILQGSDLLPIVEASQDRGSTTAKELDLSGIVRVYSLETYDRGYALVMEDFGGISLERYRYQVGEVVEGVHYLAVSDVLKIAIQIADTLHALGQKRLVHKDLKPANILINPTTQQVKLIDFSIASLLERETPELLSPDLLAGTLAYMPPEQTGRMNRGIDYRSDFYAVGVTLYELLTGRLPFEERDPIELIHAHLNRAAVSVDRVNLTVPSVIAQIVAKLMAKNAEDRYQSALGLKYDLKQCLSQWQATGTIAKFELGERDLSDRFVIPEHLYGRESAIATLMAAVADMAAGSSELVLVAGGSGIGKTAVINEVHKPITRHHGYFIRGKFDQFNRDLPLWGFVCALRDLIGQLMNESDARLAAWKSRILTAVGDNGRVLCAAIPELERIIGCQPPVTELSGTAAQNRFKLLFQKAIEVFAQPEHPLTIFLDDLQWADSASLESIELLLQGTGHLLIVGAYRDNEVSPSHPLMLTVAKLPEAGQNVRTITLAPLTFDDTDRLVADTLRCSPHRAQPLTELIYLKTEGNPFFIIQFLKALHADGEIWFNAKGYWECDILRVQALALSDNVVEFMAAQLQKLPPATQNLLKLAACIGEKFDLETLSIVSEQSTADTATALWEGLQAGSILPSSYIYQFDRDLQDSQDLQDYAGASHDPDPLHSPTPRLPHSPTLPLPAPLFRFLHDRVQQAAYSLIPESRRQQTHLQIGRLLLAHASERQPLAKLFEIVSHFNKAIGAISEPSERVLVAELNLQAACKARATNAYGAAFSYAQIGTEILGVSGWTQQYLLTLALHETLADAALLSGDLESVPRLVQIVLERTRTPIDRVKAYETTIHFHAIRQQHQAAVARGLEILHQLGIKLSPTPDRLTIVRELAKTKLALAGKSDRQLLDLPQIDDPVKMAKLRILDLMQAPAFFCSQELMAVLSMVGIRLTLLDGNSPWAASFYVTYCIVISGLGELKQTYRLGQLATILVDRFGHPSISARVKVVAAWYTKPWQERLRTTIPLLDESVRMAMDSSNLQYIGINAGVSIATRFYAGIPLDELVDRIEPLEKLIVISKDENSQQFFDLMRQTIENLHIPSTRPIDIFKGQDELSLVSQWQAKNEAILLSTMYGFQTLLAYHFEDISAALIYANAQLPYEYSAKGGYSIARIWLFDALTRLASYPQQAERIQKQLLQRVDETQSELGKRARLMPANFQHQHDLVAAEKCRVLADFTQAIELYDRAIANAKANEYLQEEALANELAAKFYLDWGKVKIAAVYMQDAYYCYARWGAKAKTNDLERRYPQLLAPILQAQQLEFNSLCTLAKITNSSDLASCQGATLDLVSVIQSAQALSGNLELEELIHQLSQVILQNSGAQTCILALPDRQDNWQIRSISTLKAAEIATTALCPALINSDAYPANLIYWIKNTQATVVFDARQPLEVPDLYLLKHQPPSVLALPIVKQDMVLGVLYLEHRQIPDLFTDNHKTAISFLCTQAAIALHNAQLHESVVQRSAAIEASLDGFAILDGGRFIYVNQSHTEMFGYSVAEMLDRDWQCLYSPAQIQEFETTAFPAVGTSRQWRGEAVAIRKDGSTFNEEVTLFLLDNGQLICICRDITDRKSMEIALRESEERYHQLVSNVPGALYQFEVTAEGTHRLNYVSARFYEIFEILPDVVVDDLAVLLAQILPADRPSFDRSIKKATKLGKSWMWQGRISTPTGKTKWIRGESRQIDTPNGTLAQPLGERMVWDGILVDVTEQQAALHERQLAEIALRQSEARYQKLADNIPGVIYQFRLAPDGHLSYPYMSSGCWDLFEISPAAVMADANSLLKMMHPGDALDYHSTMVESAQNLTPKFWEGRAILNSGEIKWIKCVSRPERQLDESIVWDGVLLDITAQKAAQQERQRQEDALQAIVSWSAEGKTGIDFYQACIRYLADSFGVQYAFLAKPSDRSATKTEVVSLWTGTEFVAGSELDLADNPCGITYQNDWGIFPDNLQLHFPNAPIIASLQGESYLSVSIRDFEGQIFGNLGIIDTQPLPADISALQFIIQLFADRIAAEMKRQADESELRKRQQQIEGFIDNSSAAMYLKDLEGRYLLVNQTCIDLMDGNLHLILGHTDDDIFPFEIAKQSRETDLAIMRSGLAKTLEELVIHPDGTEHTYISNKFALIDEEGKPYALGGVSTDITARKQVEAELARSQRKYYSLIQSIDGVVWEYDLRTKRFSFVSDRALSLFGYTMEEWLVLDDFWQQHVHPDDFEITRIFFKEAIKNNRSGAVEYRLITAAGEIIWVYDIFTPLCDEAGRPILMNGLLINITDRKQAEDTLHHTNLQLEATIQELQEATRLKDEFLAIMSHELRTPLNAILGMSEALLDEVFGALNPKQLNSISTIERSGEHLLSVINDILDVSKIAAGKLELNIAEVALAELCRSSLTLVKQQAIKKQIQIDTDLPTNLDLIAVDERRMRQVLINLLNNAVKFTHQGGLIKLSVWAEPLAPMSAAERSQDYCLCFAVSDTGIGISDVDRAKLFQPFIQIDSRLARKYQGTGLGLVLVKQITELHGGQITVDSQVNRGSCFTVMLPQTYSPSNAVNLDSRQRSALAAVDRPHLHVWTAPQILLIEDDRVTIDTFSSYLMAIGYRVMVAQTGAQAMSILEGCCATASIAHSPRPALILMNIHMPGLDSIATIEWIRQHSPQVHIPIIALTTLSTIGEREKCSNYDADKYLTKPVKLRELHQHIQECLDLN